MNSKNKFYLSRTVNKPWGYEYVIYNDSSKIAVTYIYIKFGHKTSLHCHPSKKTAFIILDGKALVQIGIYNENKKIYDSLSRLVLRPGLFHSIESVSKKGTFALEFETPYDKNDLLRFKDKYGRQKKGYENKKYMKKLDNNFVIFKKTSLKNSYKLFDRNIIIENIKRRSQLNKLKNNSVSAILAGKIIDKNKKVALNYGEIIKTNTLKILTKKFSIHSKLLVLNVS